MGGAKKQTVGYYYYLGFHLILCHGPIDYVSEFLADKKLAWGGANWTGGPLVFFNQELFGGSEKEGGIAGRFDLDMGKPTQDINTYLYAKIGGLVPAFRGLVGLIAQQVYVGTTTYLKNMAFRATRIHTRTKDGIPQWYDAKAEVGTVAAAGPTYMYEIARSSPSDKDIYAQSAMYADAGNVYIFDKNASWFNPGTYTVRAHSIVDGSESIQGTFSSIVQSVALDGWSEIPMLAQTSGGKLYLTIPDGSFDVFDFATLPVANSFLDGNQITQIQRRNGITYVLTEYPGTGGGTGAATYVHRLGSPSEVPVEVSMTTTASPRGRVNTMWSDDTYLYFYTIDKWFYCITKTGGTEVWAHHMVVDADHPVAGPDVSSFIGSTDAVIREFSAGVLMLFGLGAAFWKIQASGWEHLGNIGSHIVDYELHGGQHLIGNFFFDYSGSNDTFYAVKMFDPAIPGDMNPAHIIRECLTDRDWGMGYQDADIDDVAFTYAADLLYDEGMGMSILWSKQEQIESFISQVCKHINAAVYVDRQSGKFVLKLIRQDYDVDDLEVLDESNVVKVDNFTRAAIGELTNSVTVKYWDRINNVDASVTVTDDALTQLQQATVNTTVEYPGFCTAALATRVAERDMTVLSTPIASCTIYCNRVAKDFNIGTVFLFTWPDFNLDEMPMRVTGIAFGDGRKNQIRITCTQDIYGMPSEGLIAPPVIEWVDPSTPPVAMVDQLAYEVPYLEAVQQYGQTSVDNALDADDGLGYVGVTGARPSGASVNAEMQTDAGAGYSFAATMDFPAAPKLIIGINKLATVFAVAEGGDIASMTPGSWLQCDDEIMVFVSYVAPNLTVKRGALDTVPQDHLVDARLYFWDAYAAIDPTQYTDGETVDVKVLPMTPLGTLGIGAATPMPVVLASRLVRPYPPAKFQINGTNYPASLNSGTDSFVVSWVHRDRLSQTGSVYLGTMDAGVGPEAGTTYNLRAYNAATSTLIHGETGLTGTSFDLEPFLPGTYNVRVELEAVRDGFISWQMHSHEVLWSSTTLRVTETGDRRITEDGNNRILES